MPLELGLFLGARRFGAGPQTTKSCLILDRDRYRYQEFISDIAGQDIEAHGDEPTRAIQAVRTWLAASKAGMDHPPGGAAIVARFDQFSADLPAICAATEREVADLTFTEFADAVSTWLQREFARHRRRP